MSKTPWQNPFVGLRPFESEDSLYYFGRDEQIKALLRQLHATRFLAVVGSSGSGKSSLIRAGLIPHLEAGFLVQDRDLWRIAKMKPGDAPLDNFARALRAAVGHVDGIDRSLKFAENSPHREFKRPVNSPTVGGLHTSMDDLASLLRAQGVKAVLDFLRPALAEADANLLLLVDQFEEIFRYSMNTEDRRRQEEARSFVALLLRLAEQTEWPVFVCLTMRSDFLGDCDVFHGLPEAMNRSQYLVPRLTRAQRREAIANPIRLTGGEIAPRLLDRLLNENVDTRDDLPVLQHAMMRTWAEWAKTTNGAIDIDHYKTIGMIQSALSQHANEALAELTEAQQASAKILFQTITETDAGNRRIRRPCHLSEIAAISGAAPETLLEIIQKFVRPQSRVEDVAQASSPADKMSALQNIQEDGRSFLVLSSENPVDDPLVDISHESLIRQWETLRAWVDEEAESAKTYRRLAESAELYQKGKAGLYREADLQVALEWREKQEPKARWAQRYHHGFEATMAFLQQSLALYRKQRLQRMFAVAALILAAVAAAIWLTWGRDTYEISNLQAPLQNLQQGRITVTAFDKQMDKAKESIRDPRRLDEVKQGFLAVLLDSMEAAAGNRPRAEFYLQTLLKNLPMAESLRGQRLQMLAGAYYRRVKQPGIGLTPAIYDAVKTWLDLALVAFDRDARIDELLADLAKRKDVLDSLQVKIPQDKRFLIGDVPQRNVRLKIILKNAGNLQDAAVFMDEAKMPFVDFAGRPHRAAFKTFAADSLFADSTRILARLHAVTAGGLEVTRPETFLLKKLRRRAISDNLKYGEVLRMLIDFDFYDRDWNLAGKGLTQHFGLRQERFERKGSVMIDHATGLMWQQAGSAEYMPFAEAAKYVARLNAGKGFAGYRGWRLPTLEEAMSLMEPMENRDLYIDAKFDAEQRWIWTSDIYSAGMAWVAYFYNGYCYVSDVADLSYYVRAVRVPVGQ